MQKSVSFDTKANATVCQITHQFSHRCFHTKRANENRMRRMDVRSCGKLQRSSNEAPRASGATMQNPPSQSRPQGLSTHQWEMVVDEFSFSVGNNREDRDHQQRNQHNDYRHSRASRFLVGFRDRLSLVNACRLGCMHKATLSAHHSTMSAPNSQSSQCRSSTGR